jgi:hypothetical protein
LTLLLASNISFGQDLSKTKTARGITIKIDTISKKNIVKQSVYKFQKDTLYFRDEEIKMKQLDSIINKKKIKDVKKS